MLNVFIPPPLFAVTETTNAQVALLPDGSVKVYDTVVDPMGKAAPEVWVLVLVGWAPELSVAVGEFQVAMAVVAPWAAVTETPVGQLAIEGAVWSTCPVAVWCEE